MGLGRVKASQPNDKKNSPLRAILLVHAIGIDFGICVVAGYFAGEWLRARIGGVGWILAGLALGLIAGAWSAALLIKKFTGAHKDG